MNEPKRRFFSGDSLQQALIQAANHFNLAPEEIAYSPIEKKHGFTKVRRKFVIEVNPDAPRKEKGAAPVRPAAPPAPLPPATPLPVYAPPPAEIHTRRHVESPVLDRPVLDRPAAASRAPEIGVGESRLEPAEVLPRERGGEEREPRRESREREGGRDGRERGPRREDRRDDRRGGIAPRGRGERGGDRDRGGERRDRAPRLGEGREARERREPSPAPRPAWTGEDQRRETGGLVTLPDTPRRPSERYPPAEGRQAEAARTAAELLLRVAGLDLEPRVLQGEDRLEVDLAGPDVDWCFADDGELVLAIEHLLPRMIRTLSGEATLVRVDCDNFQEIREERLRSLAQRMAEEVRRFGKPRTLEPLNPADRRVIHVTLADDPHVITESEGDGYFKRIMIRPA